MTLDPQCTLCGRISAAPQGRQADDYVMACKSCRAPVARVFEMRVVTDGELYGYPLHATSINEARRIIPPGAVLHGEVLAIRTARDTGNEVWAVRPLEEGLPS